MTDELTKLRPLDTLHINIDAAHELRWWSAQLHTSVVII